MSYPEHFVIKKIRLLTPTTCEVYMLNMNKKFMKGWMIRCNQSLTHKFHEQMNDLMQSSQPFQMLMQLKQFHRVDVLC
ncbi:MULTISPECIES: hypothetical protein [unclassified Acinetobacter]|uniref:hypothetical protein n=1 Tax=unclassified Acinetobacter TaxID=196816 RepID=UPI0029349E51|nr:MULTISPECIES: hypothetical protein [unclassified Acinetobacter]WOE32452.1 hypothetical protein QSG84_04385 [Acinetobacter sp. SAAs470]WOE37927.1 hypothetical protein QSG86_13435 [Acinetobacter sp. SAAs474]